MEFLINETLAGRGERLKGYNIALEVFDRPAVHGVGGATGVLLTAIFVDAALGGAGLSEGRSVTGQFAIQLVGVLATLI